MELVNAVLQGVFSVVVAAYLIHQYVTGGHRREERLVHKLDESDRQEHETVGRLEARVENLEKFVREELLTIIQKDAELISDCTSVLKEVRAQLTKVTFP